MKIQIKKYAGFLLILTFLGIVQGCKKDEVPPLVKPERGETTEDLLKDSVYIYTYYFYLWQDQLPERFATRSYKTADEVLEALTDFSKAPGSNQKLDRYSFLDRSGSVNEEIQEGRAGSFGFDVRYNNDTDLYIKLVYPGSPAAAAGIARGWQILEINGNAKLDNATLEADDYRWLYTAIDGSSIALKLRKPDESVVDVTLQRRSFGINPVFYSSVIEQGAKKVGYFVFDTFVSTEDESGRATSTKNRLNQVFSEFESAGVQEVVVDLRYNGGGAVITAEYLSNMLAPLSVGNDKLMYSYGVNETLSSEDDWSEFFAPVKFSKTNGLNLQRVYFLVTEGTASASELLINNLKPYLDVKLIGEFSTYGKPVGFFPWEILNNDLYAVSFKTINAAGESDYFEGMPVDKLVSEDLARNWGDPNDPLLREALSYASTGSFSSAGRSSKVQSLRTPAKDQKLNAKLDQRGNKDMFRFRNNKK
jgi:carboxyl-terminal processing protease